MLTAKQFGSSLSLFRKYDDAMRNALSECFAYAIHQWHKGKNKVLIPLISGQSIRRRQTITAFSRSSLNPFDIRAVDQTFFTGKPTMVKKS